jgi:hypothetical protein
VLLVAATFPNATRPDVEVDRVSKPPPDSGLDYLALLRLERGRLPT